MNGPVLWVRNDSNHTNTPLYMATLIQACEIAKAGLFPFKEKETEALRGGEGQK